MLVWEYVCGFQARSKIIISYYAGLVELTYSIIRVVGGFVCEPCTCISLNQIGVFLVLIVRLCWVVLIVVCFFMFSFLKVLPDLRFSGGTFLWSKIWIRINVLWLKLTLWLRSWPTCTCTLRAEVSSIFLEKSGRGRDLCQPPRLSLICRSSSP